MYDKKAFYIAIYKLGIKVGCSKLVYKRSDFLHTNFNWILGECEKIVFIEYDDYKTLESRIKYIFDGMFLEKEKIVEVLKDSPKSYNLSGITECSVKLGKNYNLILDESKKYLEKLGEKFAIIEL